MEHFSIPSAWQGETLHGIVVAPQGAPRCLVQFVHGMSEYIERYVPVMEFLAQHGMLCFGHDHIGHGDTQKTVKKRGHMPYANGGDILVTDVLAVQAHVKAQYPSLPTVLFGHSMGSFVVRSTVAKAPATYAALIACGTGGPQAAIGVGRALTGLLRGVKGEEHRSRLLYALMFDAFSKGFPEKDASAWLSRNPENVRAYDADEKCGFMFSVGGIRSLLAVNGFANSKACFAATPHFPILLIAGDHDPVGDHGKGVKRVAELYRESGHTDVTLRLFENDRHEILNEDNRDEVMKTILDFIEEKLRF